MTTVDKVKKDLSGWKLSRCIWVMDRGMNRKRTERSCSKLEGTTSWEKSFGTTRKIIATLFPVGEDTRRSKRIWK
jgi:hypothetical protein